MSRTLSWLILPFLLPALAAGLSLTGCRPDSSWSASAAALSTDEMLGQSWSTYKQRFIQGDGRVIDRENNDRTVSEGQAYAMLRAVFVDDPATFELTLQWAENNLRQRDAAGNPVNQLWAWKWGQKEDGSWGTIDGNFASDADLDAALALILASRRWNRPEYLELAQAKLKELWDLSTLTVSLPDSEETVRYFLPGPLSAFQPDPNTLVLNPSYQAPYAYRIFAQVDGDRDWLSLVESSYKVLEESSQVSLVGLPSDWVALDLTSGRFHAVPLTSNLRSMYSFDAFRVWWRVALDAQWFDEPRAKQFLVDHLPYLQEFWETKQSIPARVTLIGTPLAGYEATSQYAMLYAAFRVTNPEIAEQISAQKLATTYQDGIWDSDSAYYTQNLAWLGLFSPTELAANWITP